MDSPELDPTNDSKRNEKSLSLLTRKFVQLLLSSKKGILDLKVVSFELFISKMFSIIQIRFNFWWLSEIF